MRKHIGNITLEDNYEGLGVLGGQPFIVSKATPKVNDLIVVTNGERRYADHYRNGDVFKVTEVDKMGCVYTDEDMGDGSNMYFLHDEVSLLEPTNYLGRMYTLFYHNGGWVGINRKNKKRFKGVHHV